MEKVENFKLLHIVVKAMPAFSLRLGNLVNIGFRLFRRKLKDPSFIRKSGAAFIYGNQQISSGQLSDVPYSADAVQEHTTFIPQAIIGEKSLQAQRAYQKGAVPIAKVAVFQLE